MLLYLPAPEGALCDCEPDHPAVWIVIRDGFWDGMQVCADLEHQERALDVQPTTNDPWPLEKVCEYVDDVFDYLES